MKSTLRSILVMGVGAGLLQAAVAADNAPAVPPAPGQQAPPTQPAPPAQPAMPAPKAPAAPALPQGFKDQKELMSYSIGMSIGKTIKQGMIDLDLDVLAGAMRESVNGGTMRLTDDQMGQGTRAYSTASNAKRQEEQRKTAEKNRELGDAFLAENKKKEGVKTLMVPVPGGKTAELQYKIITEGTGPTPKSNEVVTVKYRGTTLDGKEFDNSSKRGPGPAIQRLERSLGGDEGRLEMGALHSLDPGSRGSAHSSERGTRVHLDLRNGIDRHRGRAGAGPAGRRSWSDPAHQRHNPCALERGDQERRQA